MPGEVRKREGRTPKPMRKGRQKRTPDRKTQKKNSIGKFPLLVKTFQEAWMRAEVRTRRILRGVKFFPFLVGIEERSA